MAASATNIALSSSVLAAPSTLSSRSSFAPQLVNVAAPRSAARRSLVAVRASASEEPRTVRKDLIAGLLAAGAALAVAGSSMIDVGSAIAATGPGNDGAAITAKQADDLNKAADDFTNKDSPPRFGGERVGPQAQRNSDKLTQQAGSGAIPGLQNNIDAGNTAIETAKTNVEKTGERLGDLFKPNSDVSSSNPLQDAASNVAGGVKDLVNNGPEKVKSDVDKASEKVRSDVATAKDAVQSDSASNQPGRPANVDPSAKGPGDVVEKGKGFFGNLFGGSNKSSGDMSSSNPLQDAADNVTGGVKDLLGNGPEKIKSDVETAGEKVSKDVATARDAIRSDAATNQPGRQPNIDPSKKVPAKSDVASAGDAVEEGKGIFGDVKNKITVSYKYPPETYTFRARMEVLLKDNANLKFGRRSGSA
ncbi:hypothetical protein R1sor_015657 [Riccia sorocarpa]|uniref:Uncharacterized protein n=1 Tax=Riccia sorocarpa TaxID=122646 RepID=A0ABD3HD87_9MARC